MMHEIVFWGGVLFFTITILLVVLRLFDFFADHDEWERLVALQTRGFDKFHPKIIEELPEPAKRYFEYTIKPGTPLYPVSIVDMNGKFSLGTKKKPNYQAIEASQILAPPNGFMWSMRTKNGMPISGSDTAKWTRFRIFGLVSIARLGGDPDHTLSAFGRCVAEASIWSPASLLPNQGIVWSQLGTTTARVTVTYKNLTQAIDVTVDQKGRPTEISFLRWTDANPEKVFRFQPFGALVSDFREVNGFRLPFYVEAGNMFGTEDYFPFFIAEVTGIRFP